MLEVTYLNMNDFNLGQFSIHKCFKDGNSILLPMQNLFRIGRSFSFMHSSRGKIFEIITSSPKSSVASISSITLHSPMWRCLSCTINLALKEDNRYFILPKPCTSKNNKFSKLRNTTCNKHMYNVRMAKISNFRIKTKTQKTKILPLHWRAVVKQYEGSPPSSVPWLLCYPFCLKCKVWIWMISL